MSVLQQTANPRTGYPGSPAHGLRDETVAGAQSADIAKRRADDTRRLRRVKDSREQLKSRTRARGASSGTIDTLTSNSTAAGRSYTVANVHNGVIYLRYAYFCCSAGLFTASVCGFVLRKAPSSQRAAAMEPPTQRRPYWTL